MRFLIDDKIIDKYPRKDIKEPIEGRNNPVYIIIDNMPDFDNTTQRIKKSTIEKTNKNHKDYNHLLVAYQEYEIFDIPESEIQLKFESDFGTWIDDNYPIWKRIKHLSELINQNTTEERKSKIESWINWELEQREMLKEKIKNKDYKFNFNIKENDTN